MEEVQQQEILAQNVLQDQAVMALQKELSVLQVLLLLEVIAVQL